MTHPLQCRCGTVKGVVLNPRQANRAVCYCKDCQAFAHFLGLEAEILDERGGSQVIQTMPKYVSFTQGAGALACVRLSEKGMIRWYTACCKTPIGNTLSTPTLSFIGLLHSCLQTPDVPLEDSFGPIRAYVNTQSAKGTPKPKSAGMLRTLGWFITSVIPARLDGSYKRTPFFRADNGIPVVVPKVLSAEERAQLARAVDAA